MIAERRAVTRRKVVFLVNVDTFFVSHRMALGVALRERGFEVVVAAGGGSARDAIESAGLRFEHVPFDRGGRSAVRDAGTIAAIASLYRRERPDVVHHVTIKPVLYGTLVARALGIGAVVNAVSGLGYVFIARERASARHALLRFGVESAYRIALRGRRVRTIFQNPDDLEFFVSRGLVPRAHCTLIRGSGVDVKTFAPSAIPDGDPVVVLPARMLADKGVREFVEAARRLRSEGSRVRFALVGGADPSNPAAIPEAELQQWARDGVVEWWGHRADMPAVFAMASLVALPSYREGLPLALAEAAACGRATVGTDVPGCREVVRPGANGWLVPPRDATALTDAMRTALADRDLLARFGARAREIAVAELSRERVVAETLALYQTLLGSARAA